ncbi:MAG: M55 family metallopeptidase, partial [Planctomycetota bacterium]
MKIFIMVDMEGVSGICRSSQVRPGESNYALGQRYLTADINACVEGCFQGGAKEVIVRDCHHSGHNALWSELDPRATYIQGLAPLERMPGLKRCDGLILLGYHAMAGTREAVLEHTMSSAAWQNFWINGKPAGEVAIDAALAGDVGVPTIMVSGDDKVCREARALVKNLTTVEVKKGLDCEGAILLPQEKAHAAITAGACKAVRSLKGVKPFKPRMPVRLRLELVSRGRVPATRSGVKV